MSSFFRKLSWLTQRRRKEDELRDELQFHLNEEAEQHQAEGLAMEEARRAASRDLGNITLLKENTRAMWTWTLWEQLMQDLRYAVRTMIHNPAFTMLAALSLALGIGANTAIYSFMDSILLRSLPVSDPVSLVMLNWHRQDRGRSVVHGIHGSTYDDPKLGITADIFPYPAFELFQKNDSAFASVFAYYGGGGSITLTIKGQAEVGHSAYVSGDYFRGLGVPPAAGRLIIPDDDRAGAPAIAVASFAFSQEHFGGAASAAGQSILLNNVPFTVVGVTQPEFFGVNPGAAPDFYLPMHANLLLGGANPSSYLNKNEYWIEIMARLRPGVGMAQAQATLAPLFQQWVASTAANDQERANLPALLVKEGAGGMDVLRRRYSKPLYVLITLVGLILAIACANVANLLLARAAARQREMALRISVGASRLRVVRQLLTESVLLASLGGVLGVLFAIWGVRFLTLLLENGRTNLTLHADLNWRVLCLAAALSFLTGILFGLAPALQSTRVSVMGALKEIRAGQTGSRLRVNLRHVLVVSQIAISLLMLVAAGLFVRTLSNLQSVQLGFNRESVLLFQLNARQAGLRDPEMASFYEDLRKRFSAVPGVRNVSLSNSPLIGDGTWATDVSVANTPAIGATFLAVGPAFFTTMQIPMLLGREIGERDQPGSPVVAVINDRFAKANFGNDNPVGRHLMFGGGRIAARDMEIVGVSKDARYGDLKGRVPPVVYIPYKQGAWPVKGMTYALRTAGDPLVYVNTIREIVHQADARVPVASARTQVAQIDQTINQEITFAKLCTAFAFLALTIACVGLYGTMSYNVARRTGEIGIRMALGAQRGSVVRMVLGEVVVLAAAGLAISVPTALGASKLVESFLFGMKPNDPRALTAAVVTLLSAALLAGYFPARKASRIDPTVALRHE
jgi:predicted permease